MLFLLLRSVTHARDIDTFLSSPFPTRAPRGNFARRNLTTFHRQCRSRLARTTNKTPPPKKSSLRDTFWPRLNFNKGRGKILQEEKLLQVASIIGTIAAATVKTSRSAIFRPKSFFSSGKIICRWHIEAKRYNFHHFRSKLAHFLFACVGVKNKGRTSTLLRHPRRELIKARFFNLAAGNTGANRAKIYNALARFPC